MTWATQRLDELKSGKAKAPPVIERLGLGLLDDWGEGWVRKTWQPAADLLNADGTMFGGYTAALADQMLAFAAMTVLSGDMHFRTANLTLSFIRIAKAHPLMIEAHVVAQTKQMITTRAELRRDDGELVAQAAAQQWLQSIQRAD